MFTIGPAAGSTSSISSTTGGAGSNKGTALPVFVFTLYSIVCRSFGRISESSSSGRSRNNCTCILIGGIVVGNGGGAGIIACTGGLGTGGFGTGGFGTGGFGTGGFGIGAINGRGCICGDVEGVVLAPVAVAFLCPVKFEP